MVRLNKRGVEWLSGKTGDIILMVIVMAILVMFPALIADGSTKMVTQAACSAKVALNVAVRDPLLNTEFVNPDCPTLMYTIDKDKLSGGTSDGTDFPDKKLKCRSNEKCFFNKVNKHIADVMYGCLKTYGGHNSRVFSGLKRNCAVCSRIKFTDDTRSFLDETGFDPNTERDDNGQFSYNFKNFLELNSVTPNSKYTYADVLRPVYAAIQAPSQKYDVREDEAYLVIFQNDWPPEFRRAVDTSWVAANCFGRVVFGDPKAGDVCSNFKKKATEVALERPNPINSVHIIKESEWDLFCDVRR